jgi:hypothetical protein
MTRVTNRLTLDPRARIIREGFKALGGGVLQASADVVGLFETWAVGAYAYLVAVRDSDLVDVTSMEHSCVPCEPPGDNVCDEMVDVARQIHAGELTPEQAVAFISLIDACGLDIDLETARRYAMSSRAAQVAA